MARFTFGDDIHDLVTALGTGGVLTLAPGTPLQFYTGKTGGTPTTDYLIDANDDGIFEVVATSVTVAANGYLPPFQGPDNVSILYFDPNPADADVKRVRYLSREAAGGTTGGTVSKVNTVSPDGSGNVTLTQDNIGDGTTRVGMTPAERAAITSNTSAISTNAAAITATNAALANYQLAADLPAAVDALVPTSDAMAPDSFVTRGADGSFPVPEPASADRPATKAYVDAKVGTGGGGTATGGTVVRTNDIVVASTPASTSATNWQTLALQPVKSGDPIGYPDAKTNDIVLVSCVIPFTAATASGIQVRVKAAANTPVNQLPNPDVETDLTGWNWETTSTVTDVTTAGAANQGTHAVQMSVTGAAPGTAEVLWSDWVPWSGDTPFSVGSMWKRSSATTRVCRTDAQWTSDSTLANDLITSASISTKLGNQISPTTTGHLQSKAENAIPTGAVKVRQRNVITSPVTGDIFWLDAFQLNPGATLAAWGATTTGSGVLTTAPTQWTKAGLGAGVTELLYCEFRVQVGGSGLSGQDISLEYAQSVTNATATAAGAGWVTYAKAN